MVVGAPYGGPDGHGAVYIYLGGTEGVVGEYAQARKTHTNTFCAY